MLIQDTNTRETVALPAAGADVSTGAIDLRTGGKSIGALALGLLIAFTGALANLVDNKAVSVELQHCDTEDGDFAAIPGVGNITATGADGAGASALDGMPGLEMEITLPRHTLGFIKAKVSVEAAGGDNTATSLVIAGRV